MSPAERPPMERLVGAVVVNYNGAPVTRACVDSLRGGQGPRVQVVIADNASDASDLEELEKAYAGADDVEIVRLPENRHFAGGVNGGAVRALELGATHLFILNNDTVIEPDCVARMVAVAEAMPEAGIVGPALLDLGDRHALSLGERYSSWSLAVPRTLLKVRSTGDNRPYPVGGIMGSAIFVTRECFERVGPYDEGLLVYYEEVDFCLRARALGYGPMLEPRAVVLHDGMRGFTAGLTPYAARLKCRNMFHLMRKHAGVGAWLAFTPVYAALIAGSAAIYAARGKWDVVRALAQGVRDGITGAPAQ
ncbi:MAG: glycosyltransferase family 2 protein [Candidatus Binatia bacterium]|nr:glycosyltransferase family 2 protein [Candidatus Binatia bacterium]